MISYVDLRWTCWKNWIWFIFILWIVVWYYMVTSQPSTVVTADTDWLSILSEENVLFIRQDRLIKAVHYNGKLSFWLYPSGLVSQVSHIGGIIIPAPLISKDINKLCCIISSHWSSVNLSLINILSEIRFCLILNQNGQSICVVVYRAANITRFDQ